VTIVGMPTFGIEQFLTIVNATDQIMIYCFADPSLGGSLSGNTLTLTFDTTAMSATDELQVYMDFPSTTIKDQAEMHDNYTHILLERIAGLLAPMATQDAAQRQRVSVDAFPGTIATITTLTGITNAVPLGNLATMGGVDPRFLFIENARNSYSNGLRSKLSFTN
jgi:hypothetical protein